jgi:hypothetical protein
MTSRLPAAWRLPIAAGVALAAIGAQGCGQDAAPKVPAGAIYVDTDGVGGKCADTRTAQQARSDRTPLCTLEKAARVAPARAVVVVRAGRYGRVALDGVRRRSPVVLRSYPGEAVQLSGGVTIARSTNLRLRGFRIRSAETASSIVASSDIELSHNDISGEGIVVRNARRVTIADNRIHDLVRHPGPEGVDGYGVWANGYEKGAPGEQLAELVIRGNLFRRIPQDAVQIGGGTDLVSDVLIDGNRIDHVVRAQKDDHPDAIQVLGGRDVTIRRNTVSQAEECLLVKDGVTQNLVVQGNLMVGSRGMGHCAQIYDAPGARIVGNTFWQRADGWPQALVLGTAGLVAPTGTVVRDNVINRYQLQDMAWVRQADNMIADGPRGPADSPRPPVLDAHFRLPPGSPPVGARPR